MKFKLAHTAIDREMMVLTKDLDIQLQNTRRLHKVDTNKFDQERKVGDIGGYGGVIPK